MGSSLRTNLFEIPVLPLFPVHHVMEDRDHDVPHLHLRNQSHAQERSDHSRDEVDLVFTCSQRQLRLKTDDDECWMESLRHHHLTQVLPHVEEFIGHHHPHVTVPAGGAQDSFKGTDAEGIYPG